jgi:LemA protein
MKIFMWLILIAILIGVFYDFETIRRLRKQINQSWSTMNWCMEEKLKVILKLLEMGKYFLYEEREYVKSIIDSVHSVKAADNIEEKIRADRDLDNQLNAFLLKLKAQPELKKLHEYREQMNKFEDLDKRSTTASNTYNEIARHHNRKISSFPSNIIALLFKFKKYPTK